MRTRRFARVLCLSLSVLMCLSGCHRQAPQPTQPSPAPTTLPPQTQASTEPEPTVPPTENPVLSLVDSMTLPELVGQLFLARCPDSGALEDAKAYHLGGYILFGRDFNGQTPESVTRPIAGYQQAASIPMLIAVDEEGGTVTRVSRYPAFRSEPFPSPHSLFDRGGLAAVLEAEGEKCLLLSSLGINVNMAPVCDVSTDPGAFMFRRSLGQNPQTTAQFAGAVTELMGQHRIGSVLKHFPGYGNNADTHTGIARDDRSLEELEERDLLPLAAGIEAGCGGILVSHTIVSCLDSEAPASLSPAVHSYLRNTMGFNGVIVTDDLAMGAITELYGTEEAAVLAILAGNDLLCTTHYAVQYNAILTAVEDGRISREVLEEHVLRILLWKQALGLI